jgi:hypothetical protein
MCADTHTNEWSGRRKECKLVVSVNRKTDRRKLNQLHSNNKTVVIKFYFSHTPTE